MAIMKKKNVSSEDSRKQDKQVYALDIGSTYIRVVSGIVSPDKQIKIVGIRQCPSDGVVRGNISDIDSLARRIAVILQDFQNNFGVTISQVVTEVPGSFILSENQVGSATIQSGTINIYDRNRAIKNALAGVKMNENEYTIIHSIPQKFTTEISDQVKSPIGMFAKRLEVNVHAIGCSYMFKKNIEQAIKMTNPDMEVSSIIYAGNAASSAVLYESDKEIGVINIDIGGGSVNVTVYDNNRQLISFGIPDGGEYITKAIAKAFSISMKNAENIKCQFGCADPDLLSEEERNTSIRVPETEVNTSQVSGAEISVNKAYLADIIKRSLTSMLEYIFMRIDNYVGDQSIKKLEIGTGVVLTGGTSKLSGIENMFSAFIENYNYRDNSAIKCNPKVRIGHPIGISVFEDAGKPEFISDSDKAVAIGLLRSAVFDDVKQFTNDEHDEEKSSGKGILKGIREWLGREL